ncbi:MAG: IS110 family transposase [Streptosporangiaceae bacterium]
MKYAQILVLPQTPPGGVTAGIDWASADHVACVVDAAGQVRARFSVTHDRAGIRKLITGLRAAGARGRDRAQRRGAGRCAAGCGADRGGDHLPADEEPAVPLRVGRRQGRPV